MIRRDQISPQDLLRVEELALWHARGLQWSIMQRQALVQTATIVYAQGIVPYRCVCGRQYPWRRCWACSPVAIRPLDASGYATVSEPPEVQAAIMRRRFRLL